MPTEFMSCSYYLFLFLFKREFLFSRISVLESYGGQMEGNRGRRVGYGGRIEEDSRENRGRDDVGRRRGPRRGGYMAQDYGILPEYEEGE